jgi:hypothetical protein
MVDARESIPELEPGVAELLASFQRETARDPVAVEAALQRVTARLAAPAAATGAGMTSVAAKLVVAGLVLGGGGWWAATRATQEPPTVSIASASAPRDATPDRVAVEAVPRPLPEAVPPALPVAAVPSPAANVAAPPAVRAPAARAPRSKPAPVPEAPAGTTSLAAELRLLTAARSALRSGDAELALRRLRDHGASFPDSTLARERDATEVKALCALGRIDDARSLAAAYAARFGLPEAPLLSTCGDRP